MAYNFDAALKSGLTPQQITSYLTAQGRADEAHSHFNMPTEEKKPSMISHLLGGIKNYAKNVVNDFKTRGENLVSDFKKTSFSPDYNPKTQQNVGTTILSTAGNVAGGVGDFFSELIKPVINKGADVLSNNKSFQNFANSSKGEAISKTADKAQAVYEALKQKHPEIAKDLESSFNVASLIGPESKAANLVEQGTRTGAKATGELAGKVVQEVGELGAKVKTGIKEIPTKAADIATTIDQNVITEAEKASIPKEIRTKTTQDYFKAAKEAIADNSKPTPLELAGNKAQEALKHINDKLKVVGEAKKAATQVVGKKGVGPIIQESLAKLETEVKNRFGGKFDEAGDIINTSGRSLRISNTDKALIQIVKRKLEEIKKFPTVQRTDDAIDFIQRELYKTEKNLTLPANKEVNAFLREIEGGLNRQLKKVAGEAYTKANENFSKIKFVKDNLNNALGIDANKGAALMKQLFSPSGTASKKLFAEIKKLTGIDLVNEATLAKYSMESVGDARQANLLNQILTGEVLSKKGLAGKLIDKGLQKLQDPEGKLLRTIEKSK